MTQQWIAIYLLIIWAQISYQASTLNSTSYIAAVMEFPPIYIANNSELTLKANSDAYVGHIRTASMNNVDIIVFPEKGLTTANSLKRVEMQDWATVVPAASENYIPCIQSTAGVNEAMRKISCAAKENKIYVVININEKLPCIEDTCPDDMMFYYNTNVVFDRMGKIIARYRKTNLFEEPHFNVTAVPEIIIFDTDFGVKFGTFICFDIMFHEPALQLTRLYQITDIIYTVTWFSEVPFLTAIQTHAGWSFSEDVNLLASGYNRPAAGSTGSGIYLGRNGIGKAILTQHVHEEMLIYEVPKIKERTRSSQYSDNPKDRDHNEWRYYHGKEHVHDELRKKRKTENSLEANKLFLLYDNIHAFQTVLLEGNSTKTVCHNDFCCEFKVNMTKVDPKRKYRLVAFSGVRIFGFTIKGMVSACGIVQCSDDLISSCGSVQESETVFNSIEITAKFDDYKNILVIPSTLNSELLPLENWTYDDHTHENHMHVTISLNNDTNDLVTFGLYSRNFRKSDGNMAVSFNTFNLMNYVMALLIGLLLSRL